MKPSASVPESTNDVPNLEFKAVLLLLLLFVLVVGSGLYVLYARGAFERTQQLVLLSDDSEGVSVGMDMTFAGFPIGRVTRITLGEDGNARIEVSVPRKDARWLRSSSIFTMERGIVGGTRIRAFSGVLDDPPLEDGAERQVLRGDAAAEIPRLTAAVRDLLANLNALTDQDAALAQSLAQVRTLTERLNGPRGAVGVLLGNDADAAQVSAMLARSQALIQRADAVMVRTDALIAGLDRVVGHTERQVFGVGATAGEGAGLVGEVRASVLQLNGLLGDARQSLQRVDAVLAEAQGIAANTREATVDLSALRAEVEASLRQVNQLVNEVNRKWPFARDTELRLP